MYFFKKLYVLSTCLLNHWCDSFPIIQPISCLKHRTDSKIHCFGFFIRIRNFFYVWNSHCESGLYETKNHWTFVENYLFVKLEPFSTRMTGWPGLHILEAHLKIWNLGKFAKDLAFDKLDININQCTLLNVFYVNYVPDI